MKPKNLSVEENNFIKKLHQIVNNTVKEEKLITDNLSNPPKEIVTRGQTISDKVARFGGSWKFIIYFCTLLLVWIIVNGLVLGREAFDPYPFILMNLILSCVAALQAPIIMMSQNRKEEKDRMRSENDYLINLKAEVEIRSLHQKIDLLLEEQVKQLYQNQAKQLEILQQIQRQLNKAS
ncbi:cyclic nucleotide-binding protein [Adhaeribacter arboris]|uniref:Cyclic nucleotide-binding protein n=1 Tax=Adhaeribacter arboris TaxID=2072846 RepID=A0A2T2YLY5_9BACT|nr:DUF1003 domain-containing protein [Adhaeribacter arboris]PSR56507.1 cyclic nucleotide-binding protein [Adhaeribacter arboris]